jgi:hypothetical protein
LNTIRRAQPPPGVGHARWQGAYGCPIQYHPRQSGRTPIPDAKPGTMVARRFMPILVSVIMSLTNFKTDDRYNLML